jgi:hypothetical protein
MTDSGTGKGFDFSKDTILGQDLQDYQERQD